MVWYDECQAAWLAVEGLPCTLRVAARASQRAINQQIDQYKERQVRIKHAIARAFELIDSNVLYYIDTLLPDWPQLSWLCELRWNAWQYFGAILYPEDYDG